MLHVIDPRSLPRLFLLMTLSGYVTFEGLAQRSTLSSWNAQLEAGGWLATGQAQPFWLRANQNGTIPLTTPAATLRADTWKAYARRDTTPPGGHFDWCAGLQLVGNAPANTQLLLPVLYGKLRWKSLELSAGRWRQLTGLGDSTLSSGFINGSGNALPIPKIQLATLGYGPFGFTKHWLAINAGYSHGWFVGAYIQGAYLHQKYLYLRMGKPGHKLKGYLGINHQVQWGGLADYLKGSPVAIDGKLPSAFKYYPDIVLGLRPREWSTPGYTSFDGAYWFGNGLGSEDIGVELSNQTGSWLLYHQHIYEDYSGLVWQNAPDGLTGLSWQRPIDAPWRWLNRVVVEYLSTMDQSGAFFDLSSAYQGEDNYFNHGQYQQGWSYLGRTIGTPFIMPQGELQPEARGGSFFPNNRLKMAYLGASGQAGKGLAWTFRLSYSRNYGTYSSPYAAPKGQLSGLLNLHWQLPNIPHTRLRASLAMDQGELLLNTLGGYIGLQKRW